MGFARLRVCGAFAENPVISLKRSKGGVFESLLLRHLRWAAAAPKTCPRQCPKPNLCTIDRPPDQSADPMTRHVLQGGQPCPASLSERWREVPARVGAGPLFLQVDSHDNPLPNRLSISG